LNKCGRFSFFPFLSILILFGFVPATSALAAGPDDAVKVCSYCHGKAGASINPEVPIIGGYSAEFLENNLKAYRDHERDCPDTKYRNGPDKGKTTNMCQVAHSMSDSDIRQIAVFFSKKQFVRAKQQVDPALVAKGKDIHEYYCEKCHSEGASEAKDDAGMMAGQWMPYLRQAFDEFATGKRPIPKKMKLKFDQLAPEDMEALVHYYGSFH